MTGRTVGAKLDGRVLIEPFRYPAWLLGLDPAPITFQKHRFLEGSQPGQRNPCPIELRNLFVKELAPPRPNVPPPGFTALFNGVDLTGWRRTPLVEKYWSVHDGVLASPGRIDRWGASLTTEKSYRDFVLMLEFRMPTISDSGVNFRRLIPEIPGFGDMEQLNLRSKGGMGHLESYYFLPKETARKMGLREEEKPHLRFIDPEVGVWHSVTITVQGRTLSATYDGEVIHDRFRYHDWMLNLDPAPIRLQKHIVVHGDNLGADNPCPIEYRSIFIKELEPGAPIAGSPRRARRAASPPGGTSPHAELLARIEKSPLPEEYDPARHQEYVDRRLAKLSGEQRARISALWREKQALDPDMPNRGFSFVRILEHVASSDR